MAFRHILVPLDGSKLAEAVLPMAAAVASATGAQVTLLHSIERQAPQSVHGERHLAEESQALDYLIQVAARMPAGLRIQPHVHPNPQEDVAQSIVEHSRELGVDLIVMCAHGSSGLQRRIFGSIAQRVLTLGSVPVLMISPKPGQRMGEFTCQQILVPLDGERAHEAGVWVAADLAQAFDASLHLLMVIYEVGTLPAEQAASATLLPSAASELLDMSCEESEGYLCQIIEKLLTRQIDVTGEVARGDPGHEIARSAQREGTDLIVMGTHGKTAMDGFWSGSVTPQVLTLTHKPVLLVPVHEK